MIPILLYHGIDPEPPARLAPYAMHPARFERHMEILAAQGRPTSTVSDHVDRLARGETPPEGTVLVTFDDGLADFATHAWPVMHGLGIACTLYVVASAVGASASWLAPLGAQPPMLTWEELALLDRAGCEIGAHSMTHPELDTLARRELGPQIRGARVELSLHLGHPVRSFAYPHGYHDARVVAEVREAGFTSACAVRNMLSSVHDDPFALARVTIDGSCTDDELRRTLDGTGRPVAPQREALRAIGWRQARRARRRLVRR